MPIVGTFNYFPSTDYVFGRTQIQAFSLVWWNQSITSYGQETVFTDIGFGGYHWHVGFKDGYWNGEGDRYTLNDILQDFYVTEPDGDPDPYVPNIDVRWQYHPDLKIPYVQFKNTAIPTGYQCEVVAPLPFKPSAWRNNTFNYNLLPATFYY